MSSTQARFKIAIVDDDPAIRHRIAAPLRGDFEVLEGASYEHAYELLREAELDLLLLDMDLPDGDAKQCVALLEELKQSDLDTLVIVLSEDDRRRTILNTMDAGAHEYFLKPPDMPVLRTVIDRALEKLGVERENRLLREEIQRKKAMGDLLGSTEVMQNLSESIRRVARSASTVVIRGESGTGKELVARAIHDMSPRRGRAFISVNCAALPETLMEAELFGYEKGAFTGATNTKEGRVELAHRGTLFLDEIGTLSLGLQSKLLRVLEERALTRLGGKKSIKVDFRLLTATNENLEELVEQGGFREDLYYRIHVVPLFVPPLRERLDDIPLLVDYFVQVYCAANRLALKRVADNAMSALKQYRWPGNVRELENVVQRMVLMSDGEVITAKDLPGDVVRAMDGAPKRGQFRLPADGIDLDKEVEAFERRWLETALAQTAGAKAKAARLLGLNRDRMKYLCRRHGL